MLRMVTMADFQNLAWDDVDAGWWRIVADMTCAACGAYQAADSDPTNDKARSGELCLRLFHAAGWRVDDADGVLCPACAQRRVFRDSNPR
ncbi:MAG: hypothetical protein Q7R41_11610 [Phycisphaerales bacterium]|nr:hypothetical protein [Phycisphaerales bacterium]